MDHQVGEVAPVIHVNGVLGLVTDNDKLYSKRAVVAGLPCSVFRRVYILGGVCSRREFGHPVDKTKSIGVSNLVFEESLEEDGCDSGLGI